MRKKIESQKNYDENAPKQYFNDMQMEVLYTGAKDNVIVAGRGAGKGPLHAAITLRNFQTMPRSTTAFVTPNSKRALTNTLPSMLESFEKWGYKRDIHWCIGRKPPKNLGWQLPLFVPEDWSNIISFYTGAIGQIISQERKGTSNSKSFDFIDIDEAKFINYEQLKDETMQANRGQQKDFGDLPYHHGMLITSDMPTSKKGSWFLKYKKEETQENKEIINLIQSLVYQRWQINNEIAASEVDIPKLRYDLEYIEKTLSLLRRKALLYREYSSLVNLQVLGVDFVKKAKRDLPSLTFQTSIMCKQIGIIKDGFYSSMTEKNKYYAISNHELDSYDYNFEHIKQAKSKIDSDIKEKEPICIAFDFNANINWLVAGQPNEDNREAKIIKSFYVKYEKKLPELIDLFCKYYEYHLYKEVIFYYDSTALGSNYAVNNEDFKWVICKQLKLHGWRVRAIYIGKPMAHMEKYLLINRAFVGRTRLIPYFNIENNEDLLISIQTAGVYNGGKDKRGEKLAETEDDKLEARTDGSDAFDTLYIGMEKFPQNNFIYEITGI